MTQIYKPKHILEQCNWKVQYNFLENDQLAKVHISWDNQGDYAIRYNKALSGVASNWKDTFIDCPPYVAPTIANLIFRNICVSHEYPYKYVFFKVENNNTTGFFFDTCSEDEDCRRKANDLLMIVEDAIMNGISPYHITLAKEVNVFDGFQICMNYYLGENLVK